MMRSRMETLTTASSKSATLQRLAALLPPGRVMTGPAQLSAYESDGLTAFQARPLAVVVPESPDEVVAVVRFCHAEKLPFAADSFDRQRVLPVHQCDGVLDAHRIERHGIGKALLGEDVRAVAGHRTPESRGNRRGAEVERQTQRGHKNL